MIFDRESVSVEGVDIYIKNIEAYIAESFLLLHKHNQSKGYEIHKLTSYQGKRQEYFDLLIDALLHNYNNVREITERLKQTINIDILLGLNLNPNDDVQTLLKDFWYLKRDWCHYPEDEEQINTITNSIKQEISSYNIGNTLFLGCGAGRLAVEFASSASKVYAMDKSFSMIWHINQLLNSSSKYEFYHPSLKNILDISYAAQKHLAYIDEEIKKLIIEKVHFFVSDALDLPFNEKTLSSVFSIYFSDVIALKLWFDGVYKILKHQGLFIHFGPLDYFFTDVSEMLSAKEFRTYFEENGFTTIVDKTVETNHLEDKNSMCYKTYRNWLFIAMKN